jgi:hypothetical protein
MKAEILVQKQETLYRIERGRAGAEVRLCARPKLRIKFEGGALDLSLTLDEAYRLGAALIISAERDLKRKLDLQKRF